MSSTVASALEPYLVASTPGNLPNSKTYTGTYNAQLSAPTDTTSLWIDLSQTPPVPKFYNNDTSEWVAFSNLSITDGTTTVSGIGSLSLIGLSVAAGPSINAAYIINGGGSITGHFEPLYFMGDPVFSPSGDIMVAFIS